MYKRILSSFVLVVVLFSSAQAKEGMWIPLLLNQMNETEMQALGMKMTADDIYSINDGSLKDAIVHFGGFCTGEVISDQGLILTNHHCGYRAIQSHSTLENNYLKDGFWAKQLEDELPNEGLFVTFIKSITDVTDQVLAEMPEGMSESERESWIQTRMERVVEQYQTETAYDLSVKSFYSGNQYFLFATQTFNDIRLVGAPPSSIGKFGADTDNWMWPRHTGDFSLFRIYADADNQPAAYSETNRPYTPLHSLPVDVGGVQPGDFTMVFGFPGRTEEYVPGVAVSHLVDRANPMQIAFREASLTAMDRSMRADEGIKIKYASRYASLSNSYKKWIGMNGGLTSTGAVALKEAYESDFTRRVSVNRRFPAGYKEILPRYSELYEGFGPIDLARKAFVEVAYYNIQLVRYAVNWQRWASAHASGDDGGEADWQKLMQNRSDFYNQIDLTVERDVFEAVISVYLSRVEPAYRPASLMHLEGALKAWDESLFTDATRLSKLENAPMKKWVKAVQKDPLIQLVGALHEFAQSRINPEYSAYTGQLDSLNRIYMQAQMEVFKERRFYPDANSTLRVSYGQVNGFEPRDAVSYSFKTTLSGVMEKYVPGDYEFDVDERLRQLYESKDYGSYADESGEVPVCFIGSNHTSGGNSGSPAINAYGDLIGLNFDRVWEGTMSDYHFNSSICRNIMVDARYILFIVDKYAGMSRLIEEMTLVNRRAEAEAASGDASTPPEEKISD